MSIQMARPLIKYGLTWSTHDLVKVEMKMIQQGGHWLDANRHWHGKGLLHHYLELRKLIWPERYEHSWTRLMYENFIENSGTILMGCASSQKTSHAAEWILLDYWCFPDNTCALVSTTSLEKLDLAVFGELKMLFQMGKDRHDFLPGHLIESKRVIATDDISEDGVRDLRKGIIGRPCYVSGKFVGLGVYAGIKQERFRFLADELQFMPGTFLDCIPNMRSNTGAGGLKVIGSGNPRHDPEDQLGIAAEPEDGWPSVDGISVTTVWPTKMWKFKCVNLIGLDSPNFHVPEDQPEPYPKLIGREFAKIIAHDYGKDSPEMETQVWGRMRIGLAEKRVITRHLCRTHKAHDQVVWVGSSRTKIYALDPSYGGGDRCVGGMIEFGKDIEGKTILFVHPPKIIGLNTNSQMDIEDQIAQKVYEDLVMLNIDPNNCFYDSFGKGTIGSAFARKFGMNCPLPVDTSSKCTQRPVREDLYIRDEKRRERRLKTCYEHYSKAITEFWFSVRYVIEAEQMRGLPMDVMKEGCMRSYYTVPGPVGERYEVEPKEDMKERLGRSPDLFDWLAIAVEGARQRGFRIAGLANTESVTSNLDWLKDLRDKQKGISKQWHLNYAV